MSDSTTSGKQDPLLTSSLGGHLVFWTVLLLASTFWAGWDEFITKRPWKDYQPEFLRAYEKVLEAEHARQQLREGEVKAQPAYVELTKKIDEHAQAVGDEIARLGARAILLQRQVDAINNALKNPKGGISMVRNRVESAEEGSRERERREKELHRLTAETPIKVELPKQGGGTEDVRKTFNEWEAVAAEAKNEIAALQRERARLDAPAQALRRERKAWLDLHLPGQELEQLTTLLRAIDTTEVDIRQVHVEDVGLIDRCTTCHMGTSEDVPPNVEITRAALAKAGVEDEDKQTMFISHPKPSVLEGGVDLLSIHPVNKFGCSPCHGGNGTGTISTHLAHGLNKHWIWKLYEKENFEAGCQQCHEGSLVLPGAPVLNEGRELFRYRGCWGCHKREGFNREAEELTLVSTAIKANRTELIDKKKEQRALVKVSEAAETDAELLRANARLDQVMVNLSELETEFTTLKERERNLHFERKRQGPNLKEIKAKLKPEWLLPWLEDPLAFRPSTKMPVFRLNEHGYDDQSRAIAAFLWQSALDAEIPSQPQGDAKRGRELFEKSGCMGCHTTDDQERKGGDFAADLSRVGEKVHYDYLVRWIYDPRVRLMPYSPLAKRVEGRNGNGDISKADFRDAGKEPVFDRTHTDCPITGGEMVVENQTVMPTLRLTWEQARDIASYLMTKKTDKAYPTDTSYLNDKSLFERGEKLVRHFGCAACHEIKGLEEEGPIGTELTKEGSKPIERLDFGNLTYEYKRTKVDEDGKPTDAASGRKKYSHKWFFMDKLREPDIWDAGKHKHELEWLRMPNFHLSEGQRVALTTFLLGSVDSQYPERFYHKATGPKKWIEEGWWVVKKYNCVGCHEFTPGDVPDIQKLEWFRGEAGINLKHAPPPLVGQGFRTNPEWLASFLKNPSLGRESEPKTYHRNGVREYLSVRMPTFRLTDNEVQILVRFFAALADQPLPNVASEIVPLPPDGVAAAKEAFESQACLRCHVTDQPVTPETVAPSFLISGARLNPEWMARWIVEPKALAPATSMPVGLFKWNEGEKRWVFSADPATWPAALKAWPGDHVDLIVRYMRQYNLIHPKR